MIRIYCDICEAEIPTGESFPGADIEEQCGAFDLIIKIKALILTNGVPEGHVCEYCALDAINRKLDKRPKAEKCGS